MKHCFLDPATEIREENRFPCVLGLAAGWYSTAFLQIKKHAVLILGNFVEYKWVAGHRNPLLTAPLTKEVK